MVDARDAAFPRETIPPAGPVAKASPFLHATFLAAALALPLGDRYQPGLPSPYLRCQALPVLPRRKQYFKTALAQASASGCRAPLCVQAGPLDGQALAAETDPAVLLPAGASSRAGGTRVSWR
ncbi:hypothetical protein [Streptomyces sp. Z26]|uniref:hypothetical protein n=1 Tax=Streptomyces sp. Z26 TaxID=2500177 RepID=UPI000FCA7823|nr:hypothetical protein [Streptomyces sp. Z26]